MNRRERILSFMAFEPVDRPRLAEERQAPQHAEGEDRTPRGTVQGIRKRPAAVGMPELMGVSA